MIGGAGFIGSAIIKKMKQQNPESKIYVVEPAGANLSRLNGVDVNIFQHSLIDTTHLVEIIEKHQIDTVVHLVSTLIPGSNYSDYKREYLGSDDEILVVDTRYQATINGKEYSSP